MSEQWDGLDFSEYVVSIHETPNGFRDDERDWEFFISSVFPGDL